SSAALFRGWSLTASAGSTAPGGTGSSTPTEPPRSGGPPTGTWSSRWTTDELRRIGRRRARGRPEPGRVVALSNLVLPLTSYGRRTTQVLDTQYDEHTC